MGNEPTFISTAFADGKTKSPLIDLVNRNNPHESTAKIIAKRINFLIPKAIYNLALTFKARNFSLFLVGGSVRDYLLGRSPCDFDFCTNATPNQMQSILSNHNLITIGAKYGTIGLNVGGILCEITTFRTERDYADNRHPQSVAFESDINADLGRRDFTINAMAWDILESQIIDIFGGMEDLKAQKIRAVGNANERFSEDALRILRAFSLVAKFGFDIDNATIDAIVAQKSLLKNIAKERIGAEIAKILNGKFALKALKLMQKNDIFAINIPNGFSAIPKKARIFCAFLIFRDAKLCESLQNKRAKSVEMIFNALDFALKIRAIGEKRAIFADLALRFDLGDIKIALALKCAITRKNRRIKKAFCPKILRFALKINGVDLQRLGFKGAQIGAIKTQLLLEIYSKNLPNQKSLLVRKARELKDFPQSHQNLAICNDLQKL